MAVRCALFLEDEESFHARYVSAWDALFRDVT